MAEGLVEAATNWKDLIYASGLLVGWLVTGFGWYVSNKQANNRESRKETKANVDSLVEGLNELVESACSYFTEEDPKAQKIKILDVYVHIESSRRKVELFLSRTDYPQQLRSRFDELYEAVTDGDFGAENRNFSDKDVEKCRRIMTVFGKCAESVEQWFSNKYSE